MNVLFTSAGRRVELLRAFRRAYDELGLDGSIVVTDVDPLAPSIRVADRHHLVPRLTDPRYLDALVQVVHHERVDLILPLIDPDIPVLARGRRRLEEAGAHAVLIPDGSIASTVDKLETRALFAHLDVPAPRTWTPAEARADALEFPVFVKPRFGSAAQQCVQVRDRRELDFFLDSVPEPIIQEYLPGPEITTDVLCDPRDAGKVLAAVSRCRIQVREGEVAKGVTVHDPAIIEYCVTIARRLEAIGPITVQCILRGDQPLFTEINPRFGGGVPLGIAAGVLSPHWLLAVASGRPVDIPPLGSYEVGLYMTRFDDSFFLREDDVGRRGEGRLP